MSAGAGTLIGFAYGEDVEAVTQRSLGYRLLAPLESQPWSAEVEGLARRLQAAPYSDHWPASELFCSVLLADGRRLVAVARYGLTDHTPDHRRGGLELVGVVGPGDLDVRSALAIAQWLRQRREETDDLHRLSGSYTLADVLAVAEPPPPSGPLPVLPVRLWQDGALLFAAGTPSEPDHRLRLLEQGAGTAWQWLPLVGADFPLSAYAQRGPLIAWTPHLAGVALKLEGKAAEPAARPAPPARSSRLLRALFVLLLLALAGLLAANLWSTWALHQRVASSPPPAQREREPAPAAPSPSSRSDEAGRERLLAALHELLAEQGGTHEWQAEQSALLARYERLARRHKELRVPDGDVQGKLTIAAISVLAGRSAGRIEETVRRGLEKGFSEKVIRAACESVHDEFVREVQEQR
jgi:hypothetical protein